MVKKLLQDLNQQMTNDFMSSMFDKFYTVTRFLEAGK